MIDIYRFVKSLMTNKDLTLSFPFIEADDPWDAKKEIAGAIKARAGDGDA